MIWAVMIGIAVVGCHTGYFERIVEKKPIRYSVYGNGQVRRSERRSGKEKRVVLKAEAGEGWMFKQWQGIKGEEKYEKEIEVKAGTHKEIAAEFVRRKWTYVVYMAGDNELEGRAVEAVNEIEAVNWRGADVSVLVLIDRTAGYDATDGDWSGTRLYEVKYDKEGVNSTMISQRLDCPVLGLKKDGESELDMSNSRTVRGVLEYARSQYQAEQYGLVVWGHGAGWKGMVKDESSAGDGMKIGSFAEAAADKGLSIIGFDTGFAGNVEVMYEVKDAAQYALGSSGASPAEGWPYKAIFERFLASGKGVEGFCEAVIQAYKEKYRGTAGADITVCRLDKIRGVFAAYEGLSKEVSEAITSGDSAAKVKGLLLHESLTYRNSRYPSDVYVDIKDSAVKLKEKAGELSGADAGKRQRIVEAADKVAQAVEGASSGWIEGKGEAGHIGIYVHQMQSADAESGVHDAAYVRGSGVAERCEFVKESRWWVVQNSKDKSVLDKLFYQYR